MRVLPWRSESWISSAASIWWTLLVSRSPSRESTERCRPSVVALGDAVMPALLTDLGDLGTALERLEVVSAGARLGLIILGLRRRDLLRQTQRQQLAGGHRRVAAHDHGATDDLIRVCAASSSMAARPEKTARRNQRGPSTPTNRAGAKTVRPSGPAEGMRVRSSVPSAPRVSSAVPPWATIDSAISARMSSQMPIGLGRREGLQLHRRVPEDGGGAHDVLGGLLDLEAQLHARDAR